MASNARSSTDCPLCGHWLIEHEVDDDLFVRACRRCKCSGTGLPLTNPRVTRVERSMTGPMTHDNGAYVKSWDDATTHRKELS